MGMKKYFVRSFEKLNSSSTSFSSWSTSPSSTSFDANDGGGDVNREDEEKKKKRKQRKPSWWKRRSSRSSPTQGGSNSRNGTQTKSGNDKSKSNRKNQDCNGNNAKDPETQHNLPPPPRSFFPSASPELQDAINYFGINNKDAFTRECIKKKYKRLSLIHHPDRNGNDERSIQEMQKINHYFELLEEELNRLDEIKAGNDHRCEPDDPSVSPTSRNNSFSEKNSNGKNYDKCKDGTRNSQKSRRSSHRRTSSAPPRQSRSAPNAYRERFRKRKSKSQRQRRNHQEHRERKTEHNPEWENEKRQESKKKWERNFEVLNSFKSRQKRLRRQNNRRFLQEKLETACGRDIAYDFYMRQMKTHRDQVASMEQDGSFQEFDSEKKVKLPTKPTYALMECCNEDVVIAMRLRETGIATEIIDQEIKNTTERWLILKRKISVSNNINSGVNDSAVDYGLSVRLDKSYHKQILEVLTRPLDEDRNTVLHYAVYFENNEVIAYLAQVARRYKIFEKFLVCTNNRNLMARDYLAGCTSNNCEVHTFVTTLTNEALVLLKEKRQNWHVIGSKMMRKYMALPLADTMFEIFLCVLVGRYVTSSGWVASSAIIALAHLADIGDCESLCGTTTKSVCTPKAIFFALHTGLYLLLRLLSTSKDLITTLSDTIPVTRPLQLVIVATIISFFLRLPQPTIRSIAYASVKIEAHLIDGFNWILSKNSNFHYSSRTTQTMADFVILSVSFLAVRLVGGPAA